MAHAIYQNGRQLQQVHMIPGIPVGVQFPHVDMEHPHVETNAISKATYRAGWLNHKNGEPVSGTDYHPVAEAARVVSHFGLGLVKGLFHH